MHAVVAVLVFAAEEVSDKKDIYPKLSELIIGALAFGVLFFFLWKRAMPQINKILEQRREKIQGDLEKAEQAKEEAQQLLADYREQLAGAREEANKVIEEARKTAEAMRRDLTAKAEEEYQAIVGRAQEEIRAERDRVFQELKTQVGELSLALAGRVVGESLDKERQHRLVDEYIEELTKGSSGNGGRSRSKG
jgi:F-type H+-transporting ATPase subunit b